MFRLRRVTWKSTPSNQRCLLSVWPFLRQGSFTPVSLRGPAPNGHPCPDGALAASMRLGPLRETCVQPAPKSRFVVSGLLAYEDQKQIKSGSRASRLKPVLRARRLGHRRHALLLVGPALAGKRPVQTLTFDRPHALRGNAARDAPRPCRRPRMAAANFAFMFAREPRRMRDRTGGAQGVGPG
ncbi:hypothetical protein SAMN05216197_12759 [Pseudomonas graminis]|uniref:DUF1534 domain-containing protein n=1 Tax=Pseudomonas graminis TaxID=158627 RepID=A0A1I0HH96_9PSED|nr:hypothetical protein SAMN05216197_12759 [Pseudomonas graminis]